MLLRISTSCVAPEGLGCDVRARSATVTELACSPAPRIPWACAGPTVHLVFTHQRTQVPASAHLSAPATSPLRHEPATTGTSGHFQPLLRGSRASPACSPSGRVRQIASQDTGGGQMTVLFDRQFRAPGAYPRSRRCRWPSQPAWPTWRSPWTAPRSCRAGAAFTPVLAGSQMCHRQTLGCGSPGAYCVHSAFVGDPTSAQSAAYGLAGSYGGFGS